MPWCPNCKLEYVEGISVCPDCGSPLVEKDTSSEKKSLRPVFKGDEETAERIAQFLSYSEIVSVCAGEPDTDGSPVLVSEQEYQEAMKLVKVFLYQESEQQKLPEEKQELEQQKEKVPAPYVKKADKYEDARSSAFTLLIVGLLGILFMVLKLAGILPFSFGSASLLFDVVMCAVFLFFLLSGFATFRRAKVLKGEIAEEVTATKEITEWFLSEYTAASIDAASTTADTTEEMKYFQRTAYMKHELNTRLTELEDSYLEDLTENLYHSLFEPDSTDSQAN